MKCDADEFKRTKQNEQLGSKDFADKFCEDLSYSCTSGGMNVSIGEESLRREAASLRCALATLREQNAALVQRNKDLVDAYWPIMKKLKALERGQLES